MVVGDVLFEKVTAKVVFQIPPDGVHVVGVVLDVGGFDEEGRALDSVVVGLAGFG